MVTTILSTALIKKKKKKGLFLEPTVNDTDCIMKWCQHIVCNIQDPGKI